ncbi:MAG: hypothetical protein JST30_16040 [Armatimonadetes bacterium]|nr:hypothetical protein [Armatimonadota bacterium]
MGTVHTILVSAVAGAASSALVMYAGSVSLQDVTPGVTETGHTNISGYALAGRFGAGVSPTLARVQVQATGSLQGVRSLSDTGVAVYGQSNATSGLGAGGYFTSKSVGGRAAVVDQLSPTGTTIGLFANAVSSEGTGVFGRGRAAGVYGETAGNTGAGIYGKTTSSSQQSSGGLFEAPGNARGLVSKTMNGFNSGEAGLFESDAGNYVVKVRGFGSGAGIGISTAAGGSGVSAYVGNPNTSVGSSNTGGVFRSDIDNAYGLVGYGGGVGGRGVRATTPSGTGYGLLAENTGGGSKVAIRAVGNTEATGTKSFVIDHPLDPANKLLRHYSAEGPEPYLIYRGTVKLGADGKAWAVLPLYFAQIAEQPHYQLTAVGAPSEVYVATEVQGNRFQIGGGKPGLKVCWTVTALRNDKYVQKYPLEKEPMKADGERGKFLHPELYGAKPEAALHPDSAVLKR